ncbi:hypothetical protein [Cellulophaga sp. Hel_I_12]|uniref:hypothetical protein n=1 Tax=Cellulophaga sp. Hel_I_12 TaxID=1249972 RepID=UPI000645C306|nr:hypothetical protein [Cellulophaga sp. Hel_I_12]
MKKQLYKYPLLLLLIVPLSIFAHTGVKGKHTKEKSIKKEYAVNADALLKVSNSYGNLNITSWNQDRIVIEVSIKVNGNNEDKVQQKLDEITVAFEANNSMVSARTIFDNNKSSWNWNWGSNNNVNMQIDYNIKVPIKNSVHLNNDYGSIILDRIDGHAKISCDYGRLEIGELHGRNNELNFDYTSKSTIGYINSGKISADYSGFTIDKAGNLEINADYTNSTILNMENLSYSCDYGKIDIGSVNNLEGNGDYINVIAATVHGNVAINSDYGGIQIGQMAADAGNVSIKSDYTGIKIGYHPDYQFTFEINTEYAGLNGKENFEFTLSRENSSEKYYKGFYGNANAKNTITISSEYGGITFTKKQ